MEPFGIGMVALAASGLATFGAFGLAFRQRRRRLAAAASSAAMAAASGTASGTAAGAGETPRASRSLFGSRRSARTAARAAARSMPERVETMAVRQAELGQRLDALAAQVAAAGAPEERLQAMAGQLLGLVRDKNATLDTALAGLDQLRARMRALEQMGEPAEARALLDGLAQRIETVEAAQSAQSVAGAAAEARLAALDGSGETATDFARAVAELGERLARLQEGRDAGLETALARLGPLETRLGALENGRSEGREALKRIDARLEALHGEGTATRTALAALKTEGQAAIQAAVQTATRAAVAPAEAVAADLARLHARHDEGAAAMAARFAALERDLAARDPEAIVDARIEARIEARIGTFDARLARAEAKAEEWAEGRAEDRKEDREALAAIAAQLATLHAARDATAEAVIARLGPVETRLAAFEAALAAADPQGALDRFAERLDSVQARMTGLEGAGRSATEVSERLADLYAQKDAAIEALVGRLAPLEARLAEIDPQGALDRFGERLEGVAARLALVEGAEDPVAEITARLAELHGQKDTAIEVLVGRLAPMEARLAEIDPQGALDRFGERLEAVQARLALIEGAEDPVAEITARLAELHAQKDTAIEALVGRLAPLEARLAEIDPQGALDRFGERLEGVASRLALVEGAEDPVAEITARLAELHAQKETAIEALVGRLAPLEARLAEIDPQGALDRFGERLEAVATRLALVEGAEDPVAEITARLAELHAQKDTAIEALLGRLAPLEERLAGVEGGVARVLPLAEDDPRVALAGLKARLGALDHAQEAVAVGLEALRAGLDARAAGEGAEAAAGAAATAALAEVVDGMTRLFAQKDAGLATLLARLAPLEDRLAAVEARPAALPAEETGAAVESAVEAAIESAVESARAEARAVAAQLAAVEAAAEASAALFADRISGLEASLPRPQGPAAAAPDGRDALIDTLRALPRVVSLHRD